MEKTIKLIGFAGPATSGKDTACDYLANAYFFTQYSFAAPTKRALMAMFSLSMAHVGGDLKEVDVDWLGKSPRQLLQTLGTEWGRNQIGDDIWVKTLARELEGDISLSQQLYESWFGVISDVRFEDEADQVRSNGGVVVHIDRPLLKGVAPHVSESSLGKHVDDVVIHNNAEISHLKMALDVFIDHLSNENPDINALQNLNPYS